MLPVDQPTGVQREPARVADGTARLALGLLLLATGSCAQDSAGELVRWIHTTPVAEMEGRVRSVARDGTRNERLTVVSHLGSLHQGEQDDPAAADLVALFLEDGDLEVLASAAFNVGYLGGRRHVGRLAELVGHPEQEVRNLAAAGIAEMAGPGDEGSLPHLYPLLADPDVLVRLSAVEAIAAIRSASSAAILLAAFPGEERLAVRYAMVVGLGTLGDTRALPLLRSYREEVAGMAPGRRHAGSFRGDDPSPAALRMALDHSIARLEARDR